MGKSIFISEKPSVALEFAKVYGLKKAGDTGFSSSERNNGYVENGDVIITWCFGHLVTMCYPDKYDEKYKRWTMETLPFLPKEYLYEPVDSAKEQFIKVCALLNRDDVETVYVCTDSGREGEYIYRLVEQEAARQSSASILSKNRRRVWIDSFTEDEIKNGINTAKNISEYDNLSASAYLRAKEDYLMGINFSRALTLKYANSLTRYLKSDKRPAISVGRVMTCVLGMVVNREREIRDFVKTPFYRVLASVHPDKDNMEMSFDAEWKAVSGSAYFESPKLYKENGFKEQQDAESLINLITDSSSQKPLVPATIDNIERKSEKKNPPLLYNLAELQNDCSKLFKISPEETLRIIQELYEKKLVTYPRTDARVLSTAVAKEIDKNIKGLMGYQPVAQIAKEIIDNNSYKGIDKSRYTNDKQITDHYAVIPTGQGLNNLRSLKTLSANVYEIIVRRFLAIFYGPSVYQKISLNAKTESGERFFAGFKVMTDEGYRRIMQYSFIKEKKKDITDKKSDENEEEQEGIDPKLLESVSSLKKGMSIILSDLRIKEGETSPPKRYSSGSMILAMENAGQLIEDDELRAQIKGSGIGTSATRGSILDKLFKNGYLNLNKKTQIITPALLGELIYEVVRSSIPQMLDPKLTASWEKGLSQVVSGEVSENEYMDKLNGYVERRTNTVKNTNNTGVLNHNCQIVAGLYKK